MSSLDLEQSIAGGRPVRLYQFSRGASRWLYTSAGIDVVYKSETYKSTPGLDDDGARQSGEVVADALNVDAPLSLEVINQYRIYPPSSSVELTILETYPDQSDALIQWVGEIVDVKRQSDRVKLVCQQIGATDNSAGLRLVWDRSCPYAVYDASCRVNPADFVTVATLTAVAGTELTAAEFSAFDDDWFAGGFVEWQGETSIAEQRGIAHHTGGTITLMGGSLDLVVGLQLKAYPGCTRIAEVCDSKFNNMDNYGGAPGMPGKSPFDGNPVF